MALAAYTPFALGVLAPFIIDDLALTTTQWGMLTGSIFLVGGLGAPAMGPIVDAVGGRRVFFGMYLLLVVCWLGMAFSPSFAILLVPTLLAGLVRAASNPAGNKLILLHSPPESRGLIMGISKSGAQVGAFLIGVVAPSTALVIGWRGVLLASIALVLVTTVITIAAVPADMSRDELRRASKSVPLPRALLGWLTPHAAFVGFSIGASHAYIVLYAVDAVGISPAEAGVIAGTMSLISILGRILWGRQADRFRSASMPLVLITLIGVLPILLVTLADSYGAVLLWAGTLLFGATVFCWVPVGMLAIIRESPAEVTGKTSGLILGAFYGGTAISPVVLGVIIDASGSYRPAWMVSVLSMTCAALVAVGWHLSKRPRASVVAE